MAVFSIPKIEYPLTQPFTLPYFTVIVCALGVIGTALITVMNVAAVGYDVVQVYSTSFNSSDLLWYEKFAPIRWLFPASWSCHPTVIEPGQGINKALVAFLKVVLVTSNGMASYNLVAFIDNRTDGSQNGLLYSNNELQSCTVAGMMYMCQGSLIGWTWKVVFCELFEFC